MVDEKKNTEDNNQRQNSIKELLTTERQYVEDLYYIIKTFLEPAYDENIPGFGASEISFVFSNIEDCYDVACQFLEELEEWSPAVGGVFLDFPQEFEVYTTYCSEFEESVKALEALRKNSSIDNWIKKKQEESGKALPIESYLLKPVQRMLRYPLLLKAICKHTKKDNGDYPALKSSIVVIEELCKTIDETKRRKDSLKIVFDTVENLDGDYQTFGFLVFEANALEKPQKRRHLLLFERFLVINKIHSGPFAKKPYVFRTKISTDKLQIEKVSSTTISCYCEKSKDTHVLIFEEEETLNRWYEQLKILIKKPENMNLGEDDTMSVAGMSVNTVDDPKEKLAGLKAQKKRETDTLNSLQTLLNAYKANPNFSDNETVNKIEEQVEKLNQSLNSMDLEIAELTAIVGDVDGHLFAEQMIEDRKEAEGLELYTEESEYAIALADFEAEDESELSLAQDEFVCVLSKYDSEGNSDWWYVSVNEDFAGYVPASYLQLYNENDQTQYQNEEYQDEEQSYEENYDYGGSEYAEGQDYSRDVAPEVPAPPPLPTRPQLNAPKVDVNEKLDEDLIDLMQRRDHGTAMLKVYENFLNVYQISSIPGAPSILAQLESRSQSGSDYLQEINDCISAHREGLHYEIPECPLSDQPDIEVAAIVEEAQRKEAEKEEQKRKREQEAAERQIREQARKLEREHQAQLEKEKIEAQILIDQQIAEAQQKLEEDRIAQETEIEEARQKNLELAEEESRQRELKIQRELEESRQKIAEMEAQVDNDLKTVLAQIEEERAVSEAERSQVQAMLEKEKEAATKQIREKQQELDEMLVISQNEANAKVELIEKELHDNLEQARKQLEEEKERAKLEIEEERRKYEADRKQKEMQLDEKIKQERALEARRMEAEQRKLEREIKQKKIEEDKKRAAEEQDRKKEEAILKEKQRKENLQKKTEERAKYLEKKREEMDIRKVVSSTIEIGKKSERSNDQSLKLAEAKEKLRKAREAKASRHKEQENDEKFVHRKMEFKSHQQQRLDNLKSMREKRNQDSNANMQARRLQNARSPNPGTKAGGDPTVPPRRSPSVGKGASRHAPAPSYTISPKVSNPDIPQRISKQNLQDASAPTLPPRRKK